MPDPFEPSMRQVDGKLTMLLWAALGNLGLILAVFGFTVWLVLR